MKHESEDLSDETRMVDVRGVWRNKGCFLLICLSGVCKFSNDSAVDQW